MGERGRPAHLTLVEKLERQKKRWRHKKARQRKESADSEWLRATNRGYFAEAEVLHWDQLIEYLILVGALDEIDAENPPRISAAVETILGRCKEEAQERGWPLLPRSHDGMTLPGPGFRGRSGSGIGKVRVRVDFDLVWTCGLEHDCDNRRKIVARIEELIFYLYSNIDDLRRPSPWSTSGTVWMRPLWSPITTNTKRYLRDQGVIGDTTAFRQDDFLTPEGHNVPPGSIWNDEGLMQGQRRRAKTERAGDDFGPEDFE